MVRAPRENSDIVDLIYYTLQHEILNLTLKPDQVLSEKAICERFSTSRTPVREAFKMLNAEGLITSVPYQSSHVSYLSMNQIEQCIYMRIAVEVAVITDFIEVATPFQVEELHHRLNLQNILLQTEFEPEEFYELDASFHAVWFNHVKKDLLWTFIQQAQSHYQRFRMLDIVAVSNFTEIVAEHETLFAIIKDKDTSKVKQHITKHLYGGIERLGKRISTEFKDYFLPEEYNKLLQY